MEIRFATTDLEELCESEKGAESYPPEVVEAFFDRISVIDDAVDERDLRALKSLHFEKLKGHSNRYSMRLNRQWRLILSFEPPKGPEKAVVVIEISKHYGD